MNQRQLIIFVFGAAVGIMLYAVYMNRRESA